MYSVPKHDKYVKKAIMKKKILLLLVFIFIAPTYALEPLPSNIRGVVPKHAVNPTAYPQYNSNSNTFNIAILPGAGSHVAFATGIIAETLEKMDYDIIVGNSSGGLTTLMAYAYDKQLLINMTRGLDTDKVLIKHNTFMTILFGGSSFADNTPLKQYLYSNITDDIIDKMANRYKKGKRGYITSSNIETGETVYWDIGAIASSSMSYDEKREILTKLTVSSTALPAIFPPEIFEVSYKGKKYTQVLADGSLVEKLPIQEWMLPTNFKSIKDKNIYLIQTKEFVSNAPSMQHKAINIGLRSLNASYSNTYFLYKDIIGYWASLNATNAYVNSIPSDSPLNDLGCEFSKKIIQKRLMAGQNLVISDTLKWIKFNK